MLEYLLAHQVFLVPLDEQGVWYRYHHLFSDLLRAQLDSSADTRQLHARASAWFAEHGMLNEAVEYALLAEQPTVAAQLVQGSAEELDRKSTRLNSSHVRISYAVFCLKKKNT